MRAVGLININTRECKSGRHLRKWSIFIGVYVIHICYSPAGRSVLGKSVPEVSSHPMLSRFKGKKEISSTTSEGGL